MEKGERKIIPLPSGRSEVWKRKLFGFYSLDGKTILDKQRAVCCVCFAEIAYSGNTTNLAIHLAKRHSDVYLTMKSDLEKIGKTVPVTPTRHSKRMHIGSTVVPSPASLHHQQQQVQVQTQSSNAASSTTIISSRIGARATLVNETVANFLARDLHSSIVADGEGFRHLFEVLESKSESSLDSDTILEVLLNKKAVISNALLQKLSEVEACALTADCWTADNGRTYATLLVRFIDPQWENHNYVLKTLELTAEQTHANHIWDINRVLADWTLMPRIVYHQSMESQTGNGDDPSDGQEMENPVITVEVSQMKVISGVTNDVGNVALALKHLGMTSVPCFANAVNAAVAAGIDGNKAPSVHELISRARRLVVHFTRSPKDRYALGKKAEELQLFQTTGEDGVLGFANELIVDVSNRWTTTAEMIRRLLELKGPLNSMLMVHKERSVRELGLTAEEWYQLEELHGAMKAVSMSIAILGSDEAASCSMVSPLLHRLKDKFMKIMEHDTPAVFQYKKVVWDHLNPHYNDPDTQALFNISSLLDPRFKDLSFLTEEQREEVIQTVRQMVLEIDETILGTSIKEEEQTPPVKRSRRRLHELEVLFGSEVDKDMSSVESTAGNELEKYLQEAVVDIKDSPLEWWRRNLHRYPSVAKLARRHLCIPATSVPSECIIGHEGPIFYNRRKRLLAEEVDHMVFLNRNFDLSL